MVTNKPFKIFVGGQSQDTREEDLNTYFSQYGEVTGCIIKYDSNTVISRGFGFVSFNSFEIQNHVLSLTHTIRGKQVDCKEAMTKEEAYMLNLDILNSKKKIFVGKILRSLKKSDIVQHFSQFGKIEDVNLIFKKPKEGFAFIVFDSDEAAEKTLSCNDHVINDVKLECKLALPRKDVSQSNPSKGSVQSYGNLMNNINPMNNMNNYNIKHQGQQNNFQNFGRHSNGKKHNDMSSTDAVNYNINNNNMNMNFNGRMNQNANKNVGNNNMRNQKNNNMNLNNNNQGNNNLNNANRNSLLCFNCNNTPNNQANKVQENHGNLNTQLNNLVQNSSQLKTQNPINQINQNLQSTQNSQPFLLNNMSTGINFLNPSNLGIKNLITNSGNNSNLNLNLFSGLSQLPNSNLQNSNLIGNLAPPNNASTETKNTSSLGFNMDTFTTNTLLKPNNDLAAYFIQ